MQLRVGMRATGSLLVLLSSLAIACSASEASPVDAGPDVPEDNWYDGGPVDAFPDAPETNPCSGSSSPEAGRCCEELACWPAIGGRCPSLEQVGSSYACSCGTATGPYAGSAERPCCFIIVRRICE